MFKKLKFPLLCLVGFGMLFIIWKLLGLPSDEAMVEIVRGYFYQYGLIAVFIAALIEGMLLVGVYLPGGVVIFLGVILAAGDPVRAALSVALTICGFSLAYTINYFLGRYGWYKVLVKFGLKSSIESAEEQFIKHGYTAIYLSYWQPNIAACMATAAGIMRAPVQKFVPVSISATILWSAFWGILAYFLGQKVLTYLGSIFFVVMIGWIVTIAWQHHRLTKDV